MCLLLEKRPSPIAFWPCTSVCVCVCVLLHIWCIISVLCYRFRTLLIDLLEGEESRLCCLNAVAQFYCNNPQVPTRFPTNNIFKCHLSHYLLLTCLYHAVVNCFTLVNILSCSSPAFKATVCISTIDLCGYMFVAVLCFR